MATRWKILLGSIAILFALVLLALKVQHDLSRVLTPMSSQPIEVVMKKVGSDIVVAKQPTSSRTVLPGGYLVAYEQDPAGFKADAKLFDTWLTAVQLANSVLDRGPGGNWVKNSAILDLGKPEHKIDPWNHSLCVMRRGDTVLVISGGPSAPGSPVCKDVGMTAEDLSKFPPGKLLQSPRGSLVLVAAKKMAVAASK